MFDELPKRSALSGFSLTYSPLLGFLTRPLGKSVAVVVCTDIQ